MGRPTNELVACPIGSLEERIDLGDVGVDDREARSAPPVRERCELQLALVAVGGRTGQIGETAEDIRGSAVHELDQVGEALIEIANTPSKKIGPEVGRQAEFGRSDFFGAQVWAAGCKESWSQLVECWCVERRAERRSQSQCWNHDDV